MIDGPLRARLAPTLERIAARPVARRVSPPAVTAAGLLVGVGACVAAATSRWWLALGLWLANRLLDGLDGPLARDRRGGRGDELGGLLDFVADFVVYSGFVVAVAIARPNSRLACTALLAAYLINNVALLSFSSVIERLDLRLGDERSLRLLPGLAEGTETIVVYVLFCVLPGASTEIAWGFCAAVTLTALQRVAEAIRTLHGKRGGDRGRSGPAGHDDGGRLDGRAQAASASRHSDA